MTIEKKRTQSVEYLYYEIKSDNWNGDMSHGRYYLNYDWKKKDNWYSSFADVSNNSHNNEKDRKKNIL